MYDEPNRGGDDGDDGDELENRRNEHAEAALLGSIIFDNTIFEKLNDRLRIESFYREDHRAIFKAMSELNQRKQPIDIVTLTQHLGFEACRKQNLGSTIVAFSYDTPMAINWNRYLEIVLEFERRRKMIYVLRESLEEAGKTDDIADLVDVTEKRLDKICIDKSDDEAISIRQAVGETLTAIEQMNKDPENFRGIRTGYVDLDKMLHGMNPSDLIVVAGRPSMGKTAFALNIAHKSASKGTRVGIYSMEMSIQQVMTRFYSLDSEIPLSGLFTGKIDDWTGLVRSTGELSELSIWIDPTCGLTIAELERRARKLYQDHQIDLLIVDYIQLMKGSVAALRRGREQEINEISRGLKALAKNLDIPIIAISQLNRQVESRKEKRPLMSDLRGSGSIEQDADVIMFIYREEYYDKNTKKPGVAEINIAKQRNGPTGTVELKFKGDLCRFRSSSSYDPTY